MAFHIPFNQRHKARRQPPVYIGFDVQARPSGPGFNWWGFHGMWLSLASLFTAGFFSPVPLLISLIGLRRPGKKMATVGALTSLGGVALAVSIVFGVIAAHNYDVQERQFRKDKVKIEKLMVAATDEMVEFRDNHDGEFPADLDANLLVIKHVDPWGESLRFDAEKDHAIIRSAGPDKTFDTRDDIKSKIKGKTDRDVMLEVDVE